MNIMMDKKDKKSKFGSVMSKQRTKIKQLYFLLGSLNTMPIIQIYLLNSQDPVQNPPLQIEVSPNERIHVLLERISQNLGRHLVENNNQTQSPAVENLRQPRLYLNGTLMQLNQTFQDYNITTTTNVCNILCDCRPKFPLLGRANVTKVGTDRAGKDIVQLTTVSSTQAPYKYQFVRTLREAIYGKVKSCVKLYLQSDNTYAPHNPPEMYACKIMFKERMSFFNPDANVCSEDPFMELATQQFLGTCAGGRPHRNVMGLVECCEDQHHIFSLMEFCDGGELYDYVGNSRAYTASGNSVSCIPEDSARGIFTQIVHGLSHMHSCFVVHSDLTLENVMIEKGNPVIAKIIDFGMSKHTLPRTDNIPGCHMLSPLQGGKQFYLAPEIWQPRPYNYDGPLQDIWSLGIMLFIMITGSPPVDRARQDCDRYRMVCNGQILDMLHSWRNDVPTLSEAAKDLITRILIPEPATMRLRLDEILEHPWCTNLIELLPEYKMFMRSVQCVRWYEAEITKLQHVVRNNSNDAQQAQTNLATYMEKMNAEKAKQPELMARYQESKERLILSRGGGGGGGNSSSSTNSGPGQRK